MQLMHMLNCLNSSNSAGVCGYSPSSMDRSSSRMIQGLTLGSLAMKSLMSTTRSRITGKLRIGSTRTGPRKFRVAVDSHTGTAAYAHPARPSEGQRPVEVILDVVQAVQDRPFAGEGNFVGLQYRCGFDLRSIP